ncbi:type VI secretion system tip protein VgrG [Chitinophaga japonensis]|uniref:Rhs element Vgr protein n=1 Tax=Chitinophaga japonensis TaxID=104662 RepID=A0A562T2Q8_CHIJA|nr:type VI secretion system tip protein VgrG [Chitinophaga japonensis]TWI87020.1 Rhs element Vgr protein [Chitinophaga japonensis]
MTGLLPIEQDTSRVSFTIKVGGEPIPGTIPVYALSVHNEVNRIPAAYISLADGDAALADWPASSEDLFVPGNEVEILAGYHGIEASIFKGIVTRHSLRVRRQRTELQVECRHKAVLMTIARNSQLFEDVKDSDIAGTLLDAYGLTGTIGDTPVTHAEMVQYDCTDWDFLVSRAEAAGAVVIARGDKTDMQSPVLATTPAATLRFGTNLVEFDAEIDGCQQYGSVKAQSWDPAAQELLEAEANDPGWVTPGNLDPAALGTAAGAPAYTLRQPGHLTEEEAQQWADARLLRSRMAFVCGRASVQGFATALPGITVALEGLGTRFNGNGWVSGIRHEISHSNWLTDLQLGLPARLHTESFKTQSTAAAALLPGINGLHTAVVTALEGDPDNEARIRVKIPSISPDGEGNRARVATLDAGDNRGTFFLPEIGDEVVVGFLNDDPRQAVVLGALHSSAKAPPLTAADDNHEKGFFTRSGMRILFNDDKKNITIDTPAGNVLLLDEDKGEVSLTDKNGNKLVLSADGITLDSAKDIVLKAAGNIKMDGKTNLEAKAGAQCKLEGSAGAELKSSGQTVIKGSMVQIN